MKLLKNKAGFTLVELLVTMAVFTVAMGAVTTFIIMSYRAQGYTLQQAISVNEARKGIETMTKELREAKMGDDGSYIIENANDFEISFYSDIDKDGATEKVRYFVLESSSLSSANDCVTYAQGGSCQSIFPNFTANNIEAASVNVCVEGDLDGGNEYVDIYADSALLGRICQTGCNQCSGTWQGCTDFDVTAQAQDGSITFTADSSTAVGSGGSGFCDWQHNNHAMKASFNLDWTESEMSSNLTLRKGVIQPTGQPVSYNPDDEEVTILSRHIMNILPVFRYFDDQANELPAPARLEDTKMLKVNLIINVDPNRVPQNYELESNVNIRNLKENL